MSHLKSLEIETPIGKMIAIGSEEKLFLLEFTDCKKLNKEIARLSRKEKSLIVEGANFSLNSIEKELRDYFKGSLKEFKTPFVMLGTPFQNNVWNALLKIPYGKTRSYLDIACAIENKTAVRAAANSNGANQLSIIIPCHRVIQTSGKLGGYAGGIARKEWLLQHEKNLI